ncbi:MAG: O-antigen ligase family protein [Bacteroidota bacterium]
MFSILYFTRIFYEQLTGRNHFHISETQFLLYYSGFVFFPFLFISQTKLDEKSYQKIFHAILFSTIILSVLTFIYYRSIIGTVGRISYAISKDANYISPLALSYTGALGIGLGSIYLITNKNINKRKKYFIIITIILSAIPFFLGASRGSLFALAVPFLFLIYKIRSIKKKLAISLMIVFLGFLIVIFAEKMGSGIITRFMNIGADIESGSSSTIRLIQWTDSLEQFWNNPFFGNSLENTTFNFHPHNIFLEVLITTGLIGFIPFIFLIIKGFKAALNVFKNFPEYSWIAALFLQSFTQNMFSGGLYSASWLFASLALLISFSQNQLIKNE